MRHLFVIILLAAAVTAFGREYRNTGDKQGFVSYSFRLKRKLNDRAGIFVPFYDRTDYVSRTVGNALSAQGGGGGKVVRNAVRKQGKEDADIIIVGIDLKKLADGDTIPLKNDRTLYQIGVHRLPRWRTLAVFSFNEVDTVEHYLPPTKSKPNAPTSVVCPNCGHKFKLIREK